jgi:hypothetical protein
MAQARDPCAVPAEQLAPLLSAFVAGWNQARPPLGGRFVPRLQPEVVSPVSAVSWLARETGLPRARVETILRRRARTVELDDADRLVTAIGQPEAFHDGRLTVVENPLAPSAVRTCCGGSLDGGGAPR